MRYIYDYKRKAVELYRQWQQPANIAASMCHCVI